MLLGTEALNPTTPYFIYEYLVEGKVFYVGISWSDVRSHKRWNHVCNLVRHEVAGTLKPEKKRDLERKSNQVIAAMYRAGMKEHEVRITWRGVGKVAAEAQEKLRISELVRHGAKLANSDHNPAPVSLEELLAHLDIGQEPNPAFQRTASRPLN